MKYKITHYANFRNYYVIVVEIDGYYVYIIMSKDENNLFHLATISSPVKDFRIISDRFDVVPYSEEQGYGEIIKDLVIFAEKQLDLKYPEIKKEIDFYIEKEMSQLNMF